jgi:hypothetical protein
MWGSRSLLTMSTANRLVLNTLQRLYTFTTSRVKTPKSFRPNHVMLIRHHTTLPRCDCIGTLQGLCKDSPMRINPLGFRTKRGIKSPSRYRVLEKPNSLLERVYTPSTPPHWSLSGKVATKPRSLIIQPSQSHIAFWLYCCPKWFSMFQLHIWSCN